MQIISRRSASALTMCAAIAAGCSSTSAPPTPSVGSVQQADCTCGNNQADPPCCCQSPILLDIAGDGFRLTGMNDGVQIAARVGYERTARAWTEAGSDDAWLVLDRNNDGLINDFSELFGDVTSQPAPAEGKKRNGFSALAVFDVNGDGIMNDADEIFGQLRAWQDTNHDGVSQPNELKTLAEVGVTGVSLAYIENRRADDHGNLFRYQAPAFAAPGAKLGPMATDVYLAGVPPTKSVLPNDPLVSEVEIAAGDQYTCVAICGTKRVSPPPGTCYWANTADGDAGLVRGTATGPDEAAAKLQAKRNCVSNANLARDQIQVPSACTYDSSRFPGGYQLLPCTVVLGGPGGGCQ